MRKTHGMSRTSIHNIWKTLVRRCTNPRSRAAPYYISRGITLCDEWRSFEVFYADMGDRPAGMSLDRIDNDKGYCKSNCRWATRSQQNENQRRRSYCASPLKGVSWNNEHGKWRAAFYREGRMVFVGYFETEAMAAGARTRAMTESGSSP